VPEGDTLFNVAAALAPLVGRPVTRLEFPRGHADPTPLLGATVTAVEARGKNLLISFSTGETVHIHLRMSGVVHLYADGETWRRGRAGAVMVLGVPGFEAVCFRAPVVRLIGKGRLRGDRALASLGPDLLGEHFDERLALGRLRALDPLPLGEAVMTQSAVAGIGNVYKSEVLFNLKLDPFASVARYDDEALLGLLRHARALMQSNVIPKAIAAERAGPGEAYRMTRTTRQGSRGLRGPLSVYGRHRRACFDCGTAIEMERQGEQRRSTYFCPTCQPRRP